MWWWIAAMAGPGLRIEVVMPTSVAKPETALPLQIVFRNDTEAPITFSAYTDSRCWVGRGLAVRFEPAAPFRAAPDCVMLEHTLSPGASLEQSFDLNKTFELGALHEVDMEWDSARVPVSSSSIDVRPIRRAKPVFEGRLNMGEPVALPGGTLTLVGHSHKSVHAGQTSPLMISFEWVPEGGEKQTVYSSMQLDHRKELELLGFMLVHREHQYDRWMDVGIFR